MNYIIYFLFRVGLLIVNAALGAGLLNFPSAFHQAGGVLTASLVQLVSRVY
jgi:sodium-coupled neutral amino acid transporter 7/8